MFLLQVFALAISSAWNTLCRYPTWWIPSLPQISNEVSSSHWAYYFNYNQLPRLLFSYTFFPLLYYCVCVLIAQSYLTLCNPMDCSLPCLPVHGILQARILEWVAISFSRGLPNPGIEPKFPALQAVSLPSEPLGKPFYSTNHLLINYAIYYLFCVLFSVCLPHYNMDFARTEIFTCLTHWFIPNT